MNPVQLVFSIFRAKKVRPRKRPTSLRGVYFRKIPDAAQINRHYWKIIDGRIHHRFYDTTATPSKRAFLVDELEVGERAAARLMGS